MKIKKPNQGSELEDNKSMKSGASSSRMSSQSKFLRSVSKVKLLSKMGGSSQASMPTAIPEEYKAVVVKMPDDTRPPTPDHIIDRLREQRELQHLDR